MKVATELVGEVTQNKDGLWIVGKPSVHTLAVIQGTVLSDKLWAATRVEHRAEEAGAHELTWCIDDSAGVREKGFMALRFTLPAADGTLDLPPGPMHLVLAEGNYVLKAFLDGQRDAVAQWPFDVCLMGL